MQDCTFDPDVEVNGQTVYAIVDGFGAFTTMAHRYLLAEGIGETTAEGSAHVDPRQWYPQSAWLRAFRRIGESLGDRCLFLIGQKIPDNAIFPPGVSDIHSAVRAIDVAYHLNHRKGHRPMFDVETGSMQEGIGHYGYSPVEGERRIISVCKTPYPCDFDQGILTAVARRFEATASVTHDPSRPCRKHGGDSCTYVITWS